MAPLSPSTPAVTPPLPRKREAASRARNSSSPADADRKAWLLLRPLSAAQEPEGGEEGEGEEADEDVAAPPLFCETAVLGDKNDRSTAGGTAGGDDEDDDDDDDDANDD